MAGMNAEGRAPRDADKDGIVNEAQLRREQAAEKRKAREEARDERKKDLEVRRQEHEQRAKERADRRRERESVTRNQVIRRQSEAQAQANRAALALLKQAIEARKRQMQLAGGGRAPRGRQPAGMQVRPGPQNGGRAPRRGPWQRRM